MFKRLITGLIFFLILGSSAASFAQSVPSSSTSTSAFDRTLARVLKAMKCDHSQASVCPSLPLAVSAIGLDAQFHALEIGAGVGVDVPFKFGGFEPAIGLAVVPLVRVDHVEQVGVFSLLLHLDVFDGFGGGVLYRAFEIGGPSPGFQVFHAKNLFAVFTLDLPESI